jgi:hypothetical protein
MVQGRLRLTNNDRWFFMLLYRWFPSILQVPLASGGLSLLLALEIAPTGRAAADRIGPPRTNPADERRKSTLGYAANLRRAAQGRFEIAQSSVAKHMVKRRGPQNPGWRFDLLRAFVIVRLDRSDSSGSAGSCEPIFAITTTLERTGRWTKMRLFSPGSVDRKYQVTRPCSAEFTIITSAFRLRHTHVHDFIFLDQLPTHRVPRSWMNSGVAFVSERHTYDRSAFPDQHLE